MSWWAFAHPGRGGGGRCFQKGRQRLVRLALLLMLGCPLGLRAQGPPEVLILNSYHPGYAWSDGEMRGVLRSLLQKNPQLLPGIEHLDWKRQPTPEQEQLFLTMLRLKYGAQKLRVVITLDDKAFELARQNRALFGGAPIVFGGVNYLDPQWRSAADFTNLTGVVESKDIVRTLRLIQQLQPGVREIVGFHDNTESARANRRLLEDAITNFPALHCRFIENWTQEELFTALGRLGPNTVAMSLGSTRDRNGVLLADDVDYLQSVVQRCAVPIYLISEPIVALFSTEGWDSAIWAGVGGYLASSDLHGERVGELANRVLAGEPADAIPVATNNPTRLAVDWRHMKRFKLPLSALPEGTEVFNQPESFYRVHRSRILLGLAVLVALAATVVVLAVNIMLRRRAEQQNLRLAAAVAQTSEIVIMLDAAGTVTYINPAFTRVTGCALEAARASLASCLRCPQGPDALARIVAQLRTAGAGSETWECQAPDGATLQLSVVGSSVRDAAGGVTGFILIARDVTREVRLEEQARTSQKMEAVGLLAGGVAHDFNNLLQVITGYTHQAMDSSAPEAERTAGLSQVLAAAERAAQLARQLLAFGRRQPLHMQDTDLNQLVVGFLKMIRRIIGEHLEVRFAPGASLGNVRADPGQLEQVILNLCVNARDAMPQGGTLTLTLDNASLDAEFCQSHPWARPGRYVRLRVTDTGCGMDKKTLSRSFDPFFTTKLPGKGTGLGLAVVYGIVQQHEGCLHVDSEPGRGTSFDIYLPVVATTAPAAPAPAPPASSATAAGTILLVEDDAAVRTLAERILRRAGYQVFLAENGADAVRCFEQHAAEIQLTVMDVVMPKMSGPEAAARMAAIRPGVPVLFCSGYSADALHPGFELRPDVQMLPKPYTPATLLARIAALLAPQPAAPAHPAAP